MLTADRSLNSPNSAKPPLVKRGPIQSAPVVRDAASNPFRHPEAELLDPEEFIKDDPVFCTRDAAAILGLTTDRLMKWRQRGQGPDYLVYEDGAIRYEFSALIAYKASSRIRPSRQPRPGRRS